MDHNSQWDFESKEAAFKTLKDLENPKSGLSIQMENLRFQREVVIEKIKKVKKDGDAVMKLIGELAGLDKAIIAPHNLVEMFKEQEEKEKANKETLSLIGAGE